MSRFMSSRFDGLEAYVPGEQPQDMQYVKLNTNESPFPPAPAVLEAVKRPGNQPPQPLPGPRVQGPAAEAGGLLRREGRECLSGQRL